MESTENKVTDTPPAELEGYPLNVRDVVFRTVQENIILRMTLDRNQYRNAPFKTWVACCGLYLYLGPEQTDKYNTTQPSIRVTHWFSSNDHDLERISMVCHGQAIRISLPNADIENIAPYERERLLDFFKQARGVRLSYTADLFGFLLKDGSEKPEVTELPFPISTN